jgi:hypothetical protein
MLGIRVGGHRDPRARASLSEVNHIEPSLYDDTCDTPSHFLQGKSATRWGFDLVEGHLRTSGLKAVTDGTEAHQYTGGLCLQCCNIGDTCHVPIGGAQKYL